MNEIEESSRLLIAFSKEFAFRKLFETKITLLLESFIPSAIDTFQDDLKIAANYFSEKNTRVETILIKAGRNGIRRCLEQYSHIIVFWDGDDLTDLVYFSQLLRKKIRIIPVQLTKVRNKEKDEKYDVYIGRGTPWGNPFPIGLGGTGDNREQVIEKFRVYFQEEILSDPLKHKALLSLRGYRLGCHCKPQACHGDIIAGYLNSYEPVDAESF